MGTLYALVLTISMANGDYQEAVLGVYGSERECLAAASEQSSVTNCYPVDAIIPADDQQPATFF
ncbi:TPA: DUF1482 family protein [Citrobacter freundii]|uniref:DUF1482 family protein n=1 Tax=Citrobacter farmeri TaxID=67824 RepID=UPI001A2D6BAC|nr:DUF1482 family protein [Citrobacter farmeri]HAU5702979.1 DUF1482 family protein [Citrobacter freundii]